MFSNIAYCYITKPNMMSWIITTVLKNILYISNIRIYKIINVFSTYLFISKFTHWLLYNLWSNLQNWYNIRFWLVQNTAFLMLVHQRKIEMFLPDYSFIITSCVIFWMINTNNKRLYNAIMHLLYPVGKEPFYINLWILNEAFIW